MKRLKRRSALRVVIRIVLLLIAGVAALQLFNAGRVFTVRSWVRLERVWSRDLPLAGSRGLLRRADPMLTSVGLLKPVRVVVEPGVSLLLDPSDDVARTILVSRAGTWEPEVWAAISGGLENGSVVFDVGAHIGYDTLKASRAVGDSGLVVAVEPNPVTVEQLRENIAASGARNIKVQQIALTDAEQSLTLFDARSTGNSGSSSLSAENAGDSGTPYTVQGRRLDAVVAELGVKRIDVIKADVEGAELLVLRGATESLKRFHPKLVLEIVPEQLQNMGTSVAQLEAFIRSLGYDRDRWIDYKNKEYTAGR